MDKLTGQTTYMAKVMAAAQKNFNSSCSAEEQSMLDADLPSWRTCVEVMILEVELSIELQNQRQERLAVWMDNNEGEPRQALQIKLLKLQQLLASIDFMTEVKNTTGEMRVFNGLKIAIRDHKLSNSSPSDIDLKLYESIEGLY